MVSLNYLCKLNTPSNFIRFLIWKDLEFPPLPISLPLDVFPCIKIGLNRDCRVGLPPRDSANHSVTIAVSDDTYIRDSCKTVLTQNTSTVSWVLQLSSMSPIPCLLNWFTGINTKYFTFFLVKDHLTRFSP